MVVNSLDLTITLALTWALLVAWVYRHLVDRPDQRVRLKFNFPLPKRANVMVIFDGEEEAGPFAARATLLQGDGMALTRDSVDGMPDGEDKCEVVAPMVASPIGGDNVHRMVGMIGIEGLQPDVKGRIRVEIFNRLGKALAAQIKDF